MRGIKKDYLAEPRAGSKWKSFLYSLKVWFHLVLHFLCGPGIGVEKNRGWGWKRLGNGPLSLEEGVQVL